MTFDHDGNPLRCPACKSMRLKVVDIRPHMGTTRRRRECLKCKTRFYTAEVYCDRNLGEVTREMEGKG